MKTLLEAMKRLKESSIQGLEHYSESEIKQIILDYVKTALLYADIDVNIVDINIYGSRNRGTAKENSDLDVVIEYEGDEREDGLFNLLNDEEDPLMIDDIRVDINPISAERSGDMKSFMSRSKEYDKSKLNENVWNTKYVDILQKAVDEISKEIPEVTFSKVTDSKYSGPRSRVKIGNVKTTYMYYDGDFFIIGDKYQSYSGTLKEIKKYLKDYVNKYVRIENN